MTTRRQLLVHGGLFVACCLTTTLVGTLQDADHDVTQGIAFGGTLMAILTCHELGHYVFARRRGVDVSLPYFIPLPPPTLGTLGAVIRMRSPIADRGALFDVGASGPIAGLVVAIPLLVVGLSLSTIGPTHAGGTHEGNSILYALLKYLVFGRWLPADGVDVQLHPMAFAAWVGLLVTMINLMPIGQLDGGHVARAVLGQVHEKWSARLHVILPVIGVATGGVMYAIARADGRDVGDALDFAKDGVLPWGVWTLLLLWMRRSAGEYHPAVGDTPLDPVRRRLAIGVALVFVLIATPVPFRQVL
jgi:membrane-associated protease RseP (regulator of RpoE activity)